MATRQVQRSGSGDPFENLRHLHDEFFGEGVRPERGLRGRAREPAPFPPVDVWMGEHDAILYFEMPGVPMGSLDLTVQGASVTLQGEHGAAPGAIRQRERPQGGFSRTVELPFEIEREKVMADYHDGILKVFLPRPESDRPRRIKIART